MATLILLWLISAYVHHAFLPAWAGRSPLEPQSLSSLFKFSAGFALLVDEFCSLARAEIKREAHEYIQVVRDRMSLQSTRR
jgi:hypothetical protein